MGAGVGVSVGGGGWGALKTDALCMDRRARRGSEPLLRLQTSFAGQRFVALHSLRVRLSCTA